MLRMMCLKGWPALWAGLLLVGLSLPAHAHNGAVAIAVPVEGIKVDGDLSDWPEGVRRYPIALPEYGDKPKDETDYQGSFRIGYNGPENALYVVVEVQDESTVIDTTAGWAQDGCDVYVDVAHTKQSSFAAQYVIWGKRLQVYGPRGKLQDVKVGVNREKNTHRYEWWIDLGGVSRGAVKLGPGMVIGVDVVVGDADRDGSFSWVAWGKGTGKVTDVERLGDVVLVPERGQFGALAGTVTWEDSAEGTVLGKVWIKSLADSALSVQAKTDSHGVYTAEMPAGSYKVEVGYRRKTEQVAGNVEVQKGKTVQVREVFFARPPVGVEVKAGKGKRTKADVGFRQGAWYTLDVSDGLPAFNTRAILQDRAGQVWVATQGGGVSRYDGQAFTTFTTQDGLVSDFVFSIYQDREGYLWFGTGGGVNRYDGKSFRTFTIQDGLFDSTVISMLQDREGYLWFGTNAGVSHYDGKGFKTFTTQDGLVNNGVISMLQDREGYLWFGTYAGVSRYDGKIFKTFTTRDGLVGDGVNSMLQDRDGNLWFGTWEGVSRYDGKSFKNFTTRVGLVSDGVRSILQDREGYLWFGTYAGVSRYDGKSAQFFTTQDVGYGVSSMLQDRDGDLWFGTDGGVSRYDEKSFKTFTTQDGLAGNVVWSILQDRDGDLWFGTNAGVSRYDGKSFKTFTHQDVGYWAGPMLQDRDGDLWFGTNTGVSRYDGKSFKTFTTQDVGYGVHSMFQDREGYLWFGSNTGVSRYDGKSFKTFTTQDGLVDNTVFSILQDREGYLWFAANMGVSRYDGQSFRTFTTQDGLVGDGFDSMLQDREGYLWIGTNAGVSRYDGKSFKTFTTQDGLAGNVVWSILQDREGHLWFVTNGGVSRYDGQCFQTLRQKDGLTSNVVSGAYQDKEGNLWFSTTKGVTRFRPPPPSRPPVFIDVVVAGQRFEETEEVEIPSTVTVVAFEFHGISFKTRPEAMIYRYRLKGYEEDWKNTHEQRVEYQDLPVGGYIFEVLAVNRDLEYSEKPAAVRLTVHPPYGIIALASGLGLALVGLVFASGYGIKRRRERDRSREELVGEQQQRLLVQEQLNKELEKELQTAHEMQMGLMPKVPPHFPGLDIAGQCLPANHVGGDLFQYFQQAGNLSIALADVTGHAMEAAIPMVMFSGVLKSQMENSGPIEELFGRLNRSLHNAAGSRTFVCFAFGSIDPRTFSLRLSSAGFPYHFRAATGEIAELQIDAYPLGVRPDTRYAAIERQLTPGDYLVFCSDGIIEATDGAGAQFGYERTAVTLRSGCMAGLSAEALLERIMGEVKAFRGETPQGDDQTVVVLKVENRSSDYRLVEQ